MNVANDGYFLLPCPSCGGVAQLRAIDLYARNAFGVRCTVCHLHTRTVFVGVTQLNGVFVTEEMAKQEAVALWNRRVGPHLRCLSLAELSTWGGNPLFLLKNDSFKYLPASDWVELIRLEAQPQPQLDSLSSEVEWVYEFVYFGSEVSYLLSSSTHSTLWDVYAYAGIV